MNKQEIIELATAFMEKAPGNRISGEIALSPEIAGMRIFDAPLFAFGDPDDPLFEALREESAIGAHFLPPREWLSGAKTVITFFLPYTERVNQANAKDFSWPAPEWLHARIEGQMVLVEMAKHLADVLTSEGFASIVPCADPRFSMSTYSSNWSERHIGYVCGLGTFGLSKGLITAKGVSGRVGSVVTEADFPKDQRTYQGLYDHCNMCGACARHCPAHAIDLKEGKSHPPCGDFIDETLRKHKPRYGCGKCQVKVPCQSGIGAR